MEIMSEWSFLVLFGEDLVNLAICSGRN
jgi:hypothetical protein